MEGCGGGNAGGCKHVRRLSAAFEGDVVGFAEVQGLLTATRITRDTGL